MGNFKNKLARFFWGRYGADELYNFCTVIIVILIIASTVVGIAARNTLAGFIVGLVLDFLCVALVVWSVFRMMSKNIYKRRAENQRFLKIKNKIFKKRKKLPPDTPEFVFRSCKHCGTTLRLPHQPGKHTVRCVKCGKTFGIKIK